MRIIVVQITCWRKLFSRAIPSTMFYRGRNILCPSAVSWSFLLGKNSPDLRLDLILTSRTETETPHGGRCECFLSVLLVVHATGPYLLRTRILISGLRNKPHSVGYYILTPGTNNNAKNTSLSKEVIIITTTPSLPKHPLHLEMGTPILCCKSLVPQKHPQLRIRTPT